MTNLVWRSYSVENESEGGVGGEYARATARRFGASEVRREAAVFDGHSQMAVLATPAQHKRIEKEVL